MFSFGPELWEVFPLFGIFLPIYGGRGVSPQFPKSLLSKNSPKIAHLNKLKVSHNVSPICFGTRSSQQGFVIFLVRPLLSKVWIYPGVFSLMYLIWAILFLTFHRGLRHRDKMYKSQYCILNKSFSVQFWSCQSNLMERGRLLRALCSKYSVFGHQHSHSGERYVLILNQIGSFRKLYAKILCQHPTFQIYFLAFSYWHWYWRL